MLLSASLKLKQTLLGMTNEMLDYLDDQNGEDSYIERNGLCDRDDEIDLGNYSKEALKRLKQMQEAERLMQMSGLMDSTVNEESLKLDPLNMTGAASHWQGVLESKKDSILQERLQQAGNRKKSDDLALANNATADQVKIITQSYLQRNFQPVDEKDRDLIAAIITQFTLNEEQARAFSIVANHATLKNPEQLKMYLGGMAGTGKSQVIKALVHFFNERNESYRFACMASTGAAASLIGGSTYHSMLGINNFQEDHANPTKTSEIHAILKNVDYIFMDEVSMIDCWSLYNICKRMCKVLGKDTEPFGGINMIFAGDFAQLPPPAGTGALYAQTVESVIHTTNSYKKQEASIGKAVWHQFTTVVILRQNMRQRTQTDNDAKFRTLLENLRYKACTEEDIAVLRSRIVSREDSIKSLTNPNFRNASVITSWNTYRDKLNDMGSTRFAKEHSQELVHFYSVDRLNTDLLVVGRPAANYDS